MWLHETYQRTASTCTRQDVDEWLATGPTTRSAIIDYGDSGMSITLGSHLTDVLEPFASTVMDRIRDVGPVRRLIDQVALTCPPRRSQLPPPECEDSRRV